MMSEIPLTEVQAAIALLPQLLPPVQHLAERHIARDQTDFIGRTGQALATWEEFCATCDDQFATDEEIEDAADALRQVASMALAQLAVLAEMCPEVLKSAELVQ
jgi:hypothetical protein